MAQPGQSAQQQTPQPPPGSIIEPPGFKAMPQMLLVASVLATLICNICGLGLVGVGLVASAVVGFYSFHLYRKHSAHEDAWSNYYGYFAPNQRLRTENKGWLIPAMVVSAFGCLIGLVELVVHAILWVA